MNDRDVVRERLLEFGWEEFGFLGYSGTSMARLARSAQTTKPSIYYYFGNKEGLFATLVETLVARLHEAFGQVVGPGAQALVDLIEAHQRWRGGQPTEHALLRRLLSLVGMPGHGPEVRAAEHLYGAQRDLIVHLLAGLRVRAKARDDAGLLVMGMLSAGTSRTGFDRRLAECLGQWTWRALEPLAAADERGPL